MNLIERIENIELRMKNIEDNLNLNLNINNTSDFKYSKKNNKNDEIQKIKSFIGIDKL